MLKYVKKFTLDILPSVVATIIGAYIVNHYIVAKPAADAPVAAAASTINPKGDAKASEPISDVVNIPEAGVKAKGISEKAVMEKSAAEKPAEKSADKPAETASIPAEPRRHQPSPREKAIAKAVQSPPPVVAPVAAAPVTIPSAEAATAAEEHRDANDLARAAIERLRGSNEAPARAQEARTPEVPRIAETPRVVSAPPMQPLPPPIMVSTPSVQSPEPAARHDDARRLTPPADIPARPLDLHAAAADFPARERTTVAEDMLSAAKSVFHEVLQK